MSQPVKYMLALRRGHLPDYVYDGHTAVDPTRRCRHCNQQADQHLMDDQYPFRALCCSGAFVNRKTYFSPKEMTMEKPNHDSNKITNDNVDNVFSYHKPIEGQPARYELLRAQAREFAKVVLANVPECADRSTALRCIREAVMWANAGIALEIPGELK